ncbi:MAG: hypothetical protein ACRD5M_08550 [Candidatus Acidiferrales bacterium]
MSPMQIHRRFSFSPSRWLMLVLVAAVLVPVALGVLFSQSLDRKGEGRLSKPGEMQVGAKTVEAPSSAPKMEPERPLEAVPVMGKIEKMEERLARGPVVAEGLKQKPVEAGRAMEPFQGKGQQVRKEVAGVAAESTQSHLRLVLRVTEGGTSEVVSATEIPGPAVLSDLPTGNFLSEIVRGGQTVAVQAIPDPFEIHSFNGPPGTPEEKHHFERVKTATILVDLPDTGLATNLEGYSVRFYKLKPGPNLERVNPETFQKLKQENRLEMQFDLPGAQLAPDVRLKGKKLMQ